ncbi:Sensor histidine kinase YycG [Curvibacter sp. AEP1-3]|uniref:sensor histidine kinase n=1 Tax=Curvibacter sp. AEP1-3 TaxID=1844971 RepID=UPI000B3C92BA|nr:ATP-binding protein [Curvibacter sp. AEP1-3]ARV18175.1 Sensor histidine kinase YycG [Curvibacter sp. AEP1-3]
MTKPEPDLLASLQTQIRELQADNETLRSLLNQQQIQARQWLLRRTTELQHDAEEQRRAEAMQRVFYRIAERATAGLSFYDFLRVVHQLLRELMFADNFYVALHDHDRGLMDYPYYVDEKDGDIMQREGVPYKRGMTEFVLESGKPQLMDTHRFLELRKSGFMAEATGDLTFSSWLGVPMQIRGRMGGVLVVQGYTPDVIYDEDDVNILGFFANHVSAAIERYQAIEELRKSEARYRSVIENVGVGVVVVQDGRMVFVNPSMERIVGHSTQALMAMPFTGAIHPDDVPAVVERHQRRLRGEPVEETYSFRIITDKGEIRTLDLSAVLLQWGHRDATLLFVVDATARVEAEQNQKRALQQQIELNDLKSRFITMASHEFRTPLATIHGSVDLLMHYDDRMPVDKKRLTLLKIDDAVERMTHMLENVLVIGRSDAGRLQFKPQPSQVAVFCKSLVDELRSAMAEPFRRIQMAMDLPRDTDAYLVDEVLIRNIVGNLLSNAIKYSPHGGQVTLRVRPRPGELVITVSDQGIGIPLADQPQLFESFHRASNVGNISGTGLGLAIVRDAVQCHGGSISLQSTPDEGSTFTVVLTAPAAPKESAP